MSSARVPPPWYVLRGSGATVNAVCFAATDTADVVVTGLSDGSLHVWDLASRRCSHVACAAHSNHGLFGLCTHHSRSDTVISHGRDAVLRVWRLQQQQQLDGGGELQLVPLLTVPEFGSLSFCHLAQCAPVDEKHATVPIELLGTAGASPNAVVVGAVELTGETLTFHCVRSLAREQVSDQHGITTEAGGMVMRVVLAWPAAGTVLRAVVGYEDGSVGAWDVGLDVGELSSPAADEETQAAPSSAMAKHGKFHSEPVTALACNRKATRCISGAAEDCIYILSLKTSDASIKPVTKITLPQRGVNDIRLRPDERLFAAACWDGLARLYSWPQGEALATLDAHREAAMVCAFSPRLRALLSDADAGDDAEQLVSGAAPTSARGTLLAIGSKDGRISLWDIYTD